MESNGVQGRNWNGRRSDIRADIEREGGDEISVEVYVESERERRNVGRTGS